MAKGYNKQFIMDIDSFADKTINTINDVRVAMAYDLFSRVVDRTPIWFTFEKHSGTAKYNWTCTLNAPSTIVLKGTDKKGTLTKARMKKVLDRTQGDDTIYFANNVPYIFHLEDGLYPKNVPNDGKHGSYNKQTHKYEVRSIGGFSTQAPQGMVKLTLAEYPHIYKKAIQKAQAKNK